MYGDHEVARLPDVTFCTITCMNFTMNLYYAYIYTQSKLVLVHIYGIYYSNHMFILANPATTLIFQAYQGAPRLLHFLYPRILSIMGSGCPSWMVIPGCPDISHGSLWLKEHPDFFLGYAVAVLD